MRAVAQGSGDETAVCPACAGTAVEAHLVKNGHAILRCRACDVAFHPGSPTPEALQQLYSASYFQEGAFEGYPDYLGDEPVHRRQAQQYLERLDALGLTPGSLLDVGCAVGFFLDEARRAGWAATGCDISGYAVAHARDGLGLDVVPGNFVDVDFGDRRFDVVTMLSVLAHLPDPAAAAAKLSALIKPGGHVVIETSDRRALAPRLLRSRWHLCSPPSVIFFHTRRSLCALFPEPGWRLVSYRAAPKWISLEHALSRLEHRATRPLGRALRALGRSRLAAAQLRYPLGDIVLAVFERVRDAPAGSSAASG